jgi:hypothetical protein
MAPPTTVDIMAISSSLLSWPGLSRPSRLFLVKKGVDARDKPAHDEEKYRAAPIATS